MSFLTTPSVTVCGAYLDLYLITVQSYCSIPSKTPNAVKLSMQSREPDPCNG